MSQPQGKRKISQTFARWLVLCVVLAFGASTVSIWLLHTYIAQRDTQKLLQLNIRDVRQDIVDASDQNLLSLARKMAEDVDSAVAIDATLLDYLTTVYDVSEINIISPEGIITHSTYPDFIGYAMESGQQSEEFLVLLDGADSYVQRYGPVSYDSSLSRKYAGVPLEKGGFLQVGYDAARFQRDIRDQVVGVTKNRHVGENGCILLCDESWTIVSDPYGNEGREITVTGLSPDAIAAPGVCFTARIFGISSYCMYMEAEGYRAIAITPVDETALSRNVSVAITLVVETVVFIFLFVLVYILLKRQIVDNVRRINQSLDKITGGDLDEVVDVHANQEFSSLSSGINTTVSALKQSFADAQKRMDRELEFAKTIQYSALPSVFPPYPDRTEFAIFATMDTAKEVGGDFYDFYLLGDNRLVFLAADVSDKGIPAAMFMMQAKTLLKSLTESGMEPDAVFTAANEKLCSNNDAEMFVTAWMGVLELDTGVLTYVNAGHMLPLLRGRDGVYRTVQSPPGLMLAGLDGIRYRSFRLQLQPGELIYLYTDGVNEATNVREELFTTARLEETLNSLSTLDPQAVCAGVRQAVDAFVDGAPQFDDITMLCLRYDGQPVTGSVTVQASVANLPRLNELLEDTLAGSDCPMAAQTQLELALEEVFVNIASYAYAPNTGDVTVTLERRGSSLTAIFRDSGKPYDPLSREDPDVTLGLDDRDIGGMGVFLVKKTMTDVRYRCENGQNILTITKTW